MTGGIVIWPLGCVFFALIILNIVTIKSKCLKLELVKWSDP